MSYQYRDPVPPFFGFLFMTSYGIASHLGWYAPFTTPWRNTAITVMAAFGALIAGLRFLYCLGPSENQPGGGGS